MNSELLSLPTFCTHTLCNLLVVDLYLSIAKVHLACRDAEVPEV